jgi:glycosyltransferase involved in cell wall biosynthesis
MRVLFAIQELRQGGAEQVVLALAEGAREAGHEAAIAAAPGPLAADLGFRAFPLPILRRRPWRLPGAATKLRGAIRSWRPDLVHSHNPGMALVSSLATVRGRRPTALVTMHGVPEEDYPAAARALRVAGLPTVACGPGVSAALEKHGMRVRRTILNGVTTSPPPADRSALAAEWGIPSERPLLVTVGRLVDQKNHSLAIRALANAPDSSLVIVGEGPLQTQLEEEAERLGVSQRVLFAGVRDDARSIMGAADAVVLCSHWEGLPLVALEALAAETPLVATDVRGLRELLVDGETALLVPPDDPRALAAALGRIVSDRQLAATLAKGGRQLARQHTRERMVREFLALYEELLSERRGDGS